MRESRDRIAGVLWSETETAKALTSLRQTLHILRRALHARGLTGVAVDKRYARLDGGEFGTDLDDLVVSVERGDPADRLMSEGRITDELLLGYDDLDPAFWA